MTSAAASESPGEDEAAPFIALHAVRFTAADAVALARFYVDALGFEVSPPQPIDAAEASLLGADAPQRRVAMQLGKQRLDIDETGVDGWSAVPAWDADDPGFQHVAIVVADMAAVHARALDHGATAVSRGGPVRLPPSAGGVLAVKLRDPAGHPFELLAFRPGAAPAWEAVRPNAAGTLGIDHSAIVVTDARRSVAFYQRHGLAVAPGSFNHGPTQAALDGLDDPRVDVIPLSPQRPTPHLELLGYRHPWHGAPMRRAQQTRWPTRTVWRSDRAALLLDPDGHVHQLVTGAEP